jgi:hypothetical protein
MARPDRLASVRHVAQIGAAIGREFSPGAAAPSPRPEGELQTASPVSSLRARVQRGTKDPAAKAM